MFQLPRTIAVCAFIIASASLVSAATINFAPVTVLGTDVGSGPSIMLTGGAAPTDLFNLVVSGLVDLQGNGVYGTNAAGVIVVAGSSGVGQTLVNGTTNFGSLLIGNSTLGFQQIFPANAANGLGSLTPPSTLSTTVSVGSLFGGSLAPGTSLQFRISDTNTFDNFGQFSLTTLSLTTADVSGVPEPSTWVLSATALALVLVFRRRLVPAR